MLLNLHVKNMAIIDEIDVEFCEGLNILSGETGAGKSIIIGSINLALGGKANKSVIREGKDCCIVQLVFSVDNDDIRRALVELDIPIEDEQIIITRKITPLRSTFKINSSIVTVATVVSVAELLLDIHGQHDNQKLLNKNSHLEIIDEFNNAIIEQKVLMKKLYNEYSDIQKELDLLCVDEDKKNREISLYQHEINEIEAANLKVNEDEEVESYYKFLNCQSDIANGLGRALGYIQDDSNNASEYVMRAVKELSGISSLTEELRQLYNTLLDVQAVVDEFSSQANHYLSTCECDEKSLFETEQRLDLINNLKSKYGKSIEAIYEYLDGAKKSLSKLENQDEYIEGMKAKLDELSDKMQTVASKLTTLRTSTAMDVCKQIKEALSELNFLDVKFDMEFNIKDIGSNGQDDAQFMISTNKGQSEAPLAKIASGGELSRVMLAIKSVMSEKDRIPTQIFDEIDTGISGRTAQMVAEKLMAIAYNRQVICITHLPQIAAMADAHYLIEKTTDDITTNTQIYKLDNNGITQELARMLGGARITQATIDSASEMKELANKAKKMKQQ